ncbi:restriction endonuclease subunit S [Psychrobacter immobilis]|uniref:restriction endonuclease subunit S n=1 Tax=Psychrobacter immobilis TaxID=498 RepID=UPI00191AD3A4|nr:restriction endonuclease subunit S [Psychrobacter immobilis]
MSTEILNTYAKYDSYKDSGVDWLGDVPSDWGVIKLKHLVSIRKRIIGHEGVSVLSITQKGIKVKDITSGEGQLSMDYSKYQVVDKGDFAMNHMDLLTGYVDISKFDGVVSPDYRVFTNDSQNADDSYLLKIFQMGYAQKIFFKYGQGVSMLGRWRLPADNFNEFLVPLPSLKEQKKIIGFLEQKTTQIDQAIDLKQQQIKRLNEYKRIIIQNAVTKGLNPDAKMKDSGVEWIGEIPEHWGIKRLKYIFEVIQTGTTPSTVNDKFYNGNINWYSPKDLNEEILKDSKRKVSRLALDQKEVKLFEADSVLVVGIGATSGKTAYMSVDSTFNQQITGFHSKSQLNLYYFYLLQSMSTLVLNLANYTTLPILNNEFFKALSLTVPPINEQRLIVQHIESFNEKYNTNLIIFKQQIERLKEYKTILINQAVTGKIKVS